MKEIKHLVYKALEENEQTRDSDKKLYWVICRELGLITYSEGGEEALGVWNFIKFAPTMESVRRWRQKIQNEDRLFPPNDPKVIKERNVQEAIYREEFSPFN